MSSNDAVDAARSTAAGQGVSGSALTPAVQPGMIPSEQCISQTAERFCTAFERASRRWERVVYPGIALVALLMLLGFYHIHTLSHDMRMIAQRIDPNMDTHMERLTKSVEALTARIASVDSTMAAMSQNVSSMSKDISSMNGHMSHVARLQAIEQQMHHINGNMSVMLGQMDSMRMNFANMNRNISKPMGFMNSFMPW